MKKTIVLILTIFFISSAFFGGIYVLANKGEVSAGFAVVPMVFSVALVSYYTNLKSKE